MIDQRLASARAIGNVIATRRGAATHGPFMCHGYGPESDAAGV
jgi:hypothetical protein